jgi:FkbM family methyltransferase
MREIAFKIIPIIGKKKFQHIWELLNRFSLAAMNIGVASHVKESGEMYILSLIRNRFYSQIMPIIIFDVGAHIGEYTGAILNSFNNKELNVYSFEPAKKSFEILKSKFGDIHNVHLFNFGLGEKEERVILFSFNEFSGNASIYNRRIKHFGFEMEKKEEIELKSLDNFCFKESISHIHLLKLDVEGHELAVLKGGKKMLEKGAIDFIQFEFGGCNIDSRTYFQDFYYLLNDRYKIFRILNNGLFPIENYKETYEIFITTNYLAIRRELEEEK